MLAFDSVATAPERIIDSYAEAVVRARIDLQEGVSASLFDRLLHADTAEEVEKMRPDIPERWRPEDIGLVREILYRKLRVLRKTVANIDPEHGRFPSLWIDEDIHNIRTILRFLDTQISEDSLLHDIGNFAVEDLKNYAWYDTGKRGDFPNIIIKTIKEAKGIMSAMERDALIEKRLTEWALARECAFPDNEYITDLVRLRIDIANLSMTLRIRRGNLDLSMMRYGIEWWRITPEQFETQPNLDSCLQNHELLDILRDIGEDRLLSDDVFAWAEYDRGCRRLLENRCRSALSLVAGPEPLYVYGLAIRYNLAELQRLFFLADYRVDETSKRDTSIAPILSTLYDRNV